MCATSLHGNRTRPSLSPSLLAIIEKSEGNSKYCRATRISKRVPNLIHSSVPSTRSHSTGSTLSTTYRVNNFKGFCVMSIWISFVNDNSRPIVNGIKKEKIIGSHKLTTASDRGSRMWQLQLYTYKSPMVTSLPWSAETDPYGCFPINNISRGSGPDVRLFITDTIIATTTTLSLCPYVNVDLFSLIAARSTKILCKLFPSSTLLLLLYRTEQYCDFLSIFMSDLILHAGPVKRIFQLRCWPSS